MDDGCGLGTLMSYSPTHQGCQQYCIYTGCYRGTGCTHTTVARRLVGFHESRQRRSRNRMRSRGSVVIRADSKAEASLQFANIGDVLSNAAASTNVLQRVNWAPESQLEFTETASVDSEIRRADIYRASVLNIRNLGRNRFRVRFTISVDIQTGGYWDGNQAFSKVVASMQDSMNRAHGRFVRHRAPGTEDVTAMDFLLQTRVAPGVQAEDGTLEFEDNEDTWDKVDADGNVYPSTDPEDIETGGSSGGGGGGGGMAFVVGGAAAAFIIAGAGVWFVLYRRRVDTSKQSKVTADPEGIELDFSTSPYTTTPEPAKTGFTKPKGASVVDLNSEAGVVA